MLNRTEFGILYELKKKAGLTQRALAEACSCSPALINSTLKELRSRELLTEDGALTEAGETSLETYRVDNAVIMAAGMSTRFAPISYERPKGVLTVKGEVLIERQIKQLKEAGIDDIYVVVGYKKEEFFYLEDKFDVRIVLNDEFSERNNNGSIYRVRDILGNTFICSSDDYFTENPFEPYVYESYYAAAYEEGRTNEYCLITRGKESRIVGVEIGGRDSWVMLGHAYWSREYSAEFIRILEDIYEKPDTVGKLWEDIYIDNIGRLPMVMRRYARGVIWEFDSLDDLKKFDPFFIENVDSNILDNICTVLKCTRMDIENITPITLGMTNLSFRFEVKGKPYVYRHPGAGTEDITNRQSETFSQNVAARLGIDGTFIYEDAESGWKISHFVDVIEPFSYHNDKHLAEAFGIIKKLHDEGELSEFELDMHEDTLKQMGLLKTKQKTMFKDFDELFERAERLNAFAKEVGYRRVLCHNDFYADNLLVTADGIELIDWEYSGVSDYASDIAVFICCCSDYSYEDGLALFELYFGRPLTEEELLHCVAYTSVIAFHWFIWALFQDMVGTPVDEYLYYYYRYTKMFGQKADELLAARAQGSAE